MENSTTIAIIGLGYVGLPLARLLATKHYVLGFDINEKRVDEINKEVAGLNVYPNPANNTTQLSFTLSNSQDVTVVVTDLSGRVVKTELFANRVAGGNIIDLPLDAIADGMYMVSIKSENAVATQRLVVRK